MSVIMTPEQRLAVDTIRTLSMDGVQRAGSGHPGTPMALAPVAYSIWNQTIRFAPDRPEWPSRDRFVLSCGHASMLLYSLLHLASVRKVESGGAVGDQRAVTLDDLRQFRQLHSPCAGHPEWGEAAGIEMTTGPLGQGVATSVGMAVAGNWLAARYNRSAFDLFGYDVYALCSDGDLMEGVSSEAASLAGHLKLSNLCWIYDDNQITIEGRTDLAFSEDVAERFRAVGWKTIQVSDANDLPQMGAALEQFTANRDGPTLIIVKSVIGYGSPNKADTAAAHGAPLGAEEVQATKEAMGWKSKDAFHVPAEVYNHFADGVGRRGEELCSQWHADFDRYAAAYPTEAIELKQIWSGKLPADWDQDLPVFEPDTKGMATRASSGTVLNALAGRIPWLVGGSADLAPSNNTLIKDQGAGHLAAEAPDGRNLHFGVREHAMGAVVNGLALSGLQPYCGTFFIFTDYMRPAIRLAALMNQRVLYVLTHDSIGLGEDGPTHQPVEQLAACRAIPRLQVFRPADANEVTESYRAALQASDRPSAVVLTRQAVPTLDRQQFADASGVSKGAYVLYDSPSQPPEVLLLGTGSELTICLEAMQQLEQEHIAVRVVSAPCLELFERQEEAYRESVLPPVVTARVAVEAGVRQGWDRWLGTEGRFIGMTDFGASAPYNQLYEHFGITAAAVADAARQLVRAKRS